MPDLAPVGSQPNSYAYLTVAFMKVYPSHRTRPLGGRNPSWHKP
jgi:hypothetical protein